MFKCLICNKEFRKFNSHFLNSHGIQTYDYLKKYYNYDIIKEYENGKSSSFISLEIKEINSGISPSKHSILIFLKNNNIKRRTSSEAGKLYFCLHDVWNKGLTKNDHPSINKYAESRKGINNPIFKASLESLEKSKNWRKYKTKEELDIITKQIGETLRERYQSGDLIPWWFTLTKEEQEELKEKRKLKYDEWLEKNCFHNTCMSSQEKMIGNFLEEKNIKYKSQFIIFFNENGKRKHFRYDFLLEKYNIIIEYNGTYWHCDPRKYERNYFNHKKKLYAWEMWENDEKKKKIAMDNGYRIIIIWEKETEDLNEEEYRKYFNEIFENFIY